jgi:FKBP-type peptidyl-prolyl cis-trans isomerase 2
LILLVVLSLSAAGFSSQETNAAAEQTSGHSPVSTTKSAERFNVPQDLKETAESTVSETIAVGDLVKVDFTMKMAGGEVIYTTRKALADDPAAIKAQWFQAPKAYGPEQVLAGKDSGRRELSESLIGMKAGGKKSIMLPPEKGFGPHDPRKVGQYSRTRTIPRLVRVKAADYVAKFGAFPVKSQLVNHVPYFKSKIKEVADTYVVLEALVSDEERIEADYGVTTLRLRSDKVILSLDPKIGAPFEFKGRKGVISKKDDKSFSVDFNHPAAGKQIELSFHVLSVEKADQFKIESLDWIEDHDEGYAAAAQQGKPMVMVLYADWCSWCEKFLGQTVKDPRVQKLWDRFVWTKVNSDQKKEYKEKYGQDGFPMIIMTNAQGEVVNSVNGYRDARGFIPELEKALGLENKPDSSG